MASDRFDRFLPLAGVLQGCRSSSASSSTGATRAVPLAWATIVMGASLLTPLGFFAFILLPVWLILVGLLLARRQTTARTAETPSGALSPGAAAS